MGRGTLRVGVWAQYDAVADAMRAHLERSGPVGIRAVRLTDARPSPRAYDVVLILRPELSRLELAPFRRARIPVLQMSDSAVATSDSHHVIPARSAMPAIVRGVVRAATLAVPESPVPTPLSARESETVVLFAQGRSLVQVADRLGVAPESVRTYLRRARGKLAADGHEAGSRERLVELQRLGVLQIPEHAAV